MNTSMVTEFLNSDLSSGEEQVESGEEDIDEEHAEDTNSNPGWADAMAKVLRAKKPKRKKSIVLSKAKKLNEVKVEKEESEGHDIKQEKIDKLVEAIKKKNKLLSKIRVKPSILDRERERRLNRTATKGVVKLFNAVREQQKTFEAKIKEAGSSEFKKEKIIKRMDKRALLDAIMGTATSEPVDNPVKKEENIAIKSESEETPTWSVLRDSFMMESVKLKDWDKEDNDET